MREEADFSAVDAIVEAVGSEPRHAIAILERIQEKFNYLPEAALRRVCQTTGIPAGRLTGLATFYSQFRLRPAGRHRIRVCVGTACHVKGAEAVFGAFKSHLKIAAGEDTDKDRIFTVEKVACLGCCMLAPAVQIGELTYGYLTPRRVPDVLRDYLAAQGAAREETPARQEKRPGAGEARICLCSSCAAAGSLAVYNTMRDEARRLRLPVTVRGVGCTGISYEAPLVELVPAIDDGRRYRYGRVTEGDVETIMLRHFAAGRPLRRAVSSALRLLERMVTGGWPDQLARYTLDLREDTRTGYRRQEHLITEHCGEVEPLDIDEHMRRGDFEALRRAASGLSGEQVIEIVEAGGLRGRGGAGFDTGRKWRNVLRAGGEKKYVICNGDEGDPGSFMDRMILESFPFRVIEGMALAAHAVGALEGFLYVRGEYPLAVRRVREAIRRCEERGLIGRDSGLCALRLEVVVGAGAFVCGEETALIAAIEGRRGNPRVRPPYPSECGLWGKPTLINNVETFALVPWILRRGAEAFRKHGTRGSAGTKTFALAGKVARGGLIEVPMGITLREIVEEIGGGIRDGKAFKAVQIGGPSGGCVPARLADTPVDYESLNAVGAMMGSGGLVVLDETDCMVDMARYFLAFTQQESCGKCTFCRVGTKRMLEILDRLCEGRGSGRDLAELRRLAGLVRRGSLCGLGRTAPNPVLSTLDHFPEEYEAHARGLCPAGKCKALIRYVITTDCIGCTRCAQNCPAEAIPADPYERHKIDDAKCVRCDTCRQVCPANAVVIRGMSETEL